MGALREVVSPKGRGYYVIGFDSLSEHSFFLTNLYFSENLQSMKKIKLVQLLSMSECQWYYKPESYIEIFENIVGDKVATKHKLDDLKGVFEVRGYELIYEGI